MLHVVGPSKHNQQKRMCMQFSSRPSSFVIYFYLEKYEDTYISHCTLNLFWQAGLLKEGEFLRSNHTISITEKAYLREKYGEQYKQYVYFVVIRILYLAYVTVCKKGRIFLQISAES